MRTGVETELHRSSSFNQEIFLTNVSNSQNIIFINKNPIKSSVRDRPIRALIICHIERQVDAQTIINTGQVAYNRTINL
jgi:hypothetical protein